MSVCDCALLKMNLLSCESLQFPEKIIINVNQNTLLEFELQSYNLLKLVIRFKGKQLLL